MRDPIKLTLKMKYLVSIGHDLLRHRAVVAILPGLAEFVSMLSPEAIVALTEEFHFSGFPSASRESSSEMRHNLLREETHRTIDDLQRRIPEVHKTSNVAYSMGSVLLNLVDALGRLAEDEVGLGRLVEESLLV